MTTQQIDEAKAEAFAGQIVGTLNSGFLTMMISIGHRTGLFDSLADLRPSTSEEVATAAGLNERYVREWLNTMTVGRIVEYNPADKKYILPPEHAGFLTRAAGPDNLATMAQYLALAGDVESKVVECFTKGGGVPYSAYPTFQKLMAEESGQVFDATLIDVTLPLVPGLVAKLEAGIDVADVGCGSGHAVNLMAKAFPNSRFVGLDFSEEGIAVGKAEAAALGLTNADFDVKDAAALSGPPKFDLITTFDSVHDQAHPDRMLTGIYESLRPGGTYLCVDIAASSNVEENMDHPLGPTFYTISTMHCMTVSLALGGMGLGTMWGEQKAHEMMREAGFEDIATHRVEGDIANNYYVARKR